jgi:hypothetical protein
LVAVALIVAIHAPVGPNNLGYFAGYTGLFGKANFHRRFNEF